ncbi:MAG: bifunctional pyr operon transcriptional regulator/uracil phosphoribosyltransferase PyrR [Syntrophobacteraceae bacterium]
MAHKNGRIIMESGEISQALARLAKEIIEQPVDPGKLVLVGIHSGGVYLAARLRQIIEAQHRLSVPVGSLDINLYRDDWTRLHTQPVVRATHLPFPIDDREVVLIDDVLYTGRTIRAALDALMDYGRPRRVQVAVLVDRGHRELPISAQFIGLLVQTLSDELVDVLLTEKDGVDEVVVEHFAHPAEAVSPT